MLEEPSSRPQPQHWINFWNHGRKNFIQHWAAVCHPHRLRVPNALGNGVLFAPGSRIKNSKNLKIKNADVFFFFFGILLV